MIDAPLGYYKVNDRAFISKMEAFIYASSLASPTLSYHYYDEIWDAAVSTYSPSTSLNELYRQRAQQIRDTHDYLILNFSGGADSTTVLETFLKNKIKLDELFVRWPKAMINSGRYKPDNTNTDATNMISEWDFSIAPKLEYIKRNYPEIKIVIGDWVETTKNIVITEDLLFKQNHNFGIANYGFSEIISDSAVVESNKGHKVANIFGIDKPYVSFDAEHNSYNMYFLDICVGPTGTQHTHNLIDNRTRVDFYHAPDFPLITVARAYEVAKYFKNHPEFNHLVNIKYRLSLSDQQRANVLKEAERIVNKVCYPSWDLNTFQVSKPDNTNKIYHPWFYYLYNTTEFDHQIKTLKYKLNDISAGIREDLKKVDNQQQLIGLRFMPTKGFALKV